MQAKRTMSQPTAVYCNKVQAELKVEIESLSRQRVLCRDIAEEECKEECRDTLNSVETMIKGKWQRNFVATILPLSQLKRLKIRR